MEQDNRGNVRLERQVRREALGDALRLLKSQKRFDLKWEWMSETDSGEYVAFHDLENALIALIHDA